MALKAKFTKRAIIFLLCALPALINGQINRSATELARENIHEYLTDYLAQPGVTVPRGLFVR